MTLNDLQGYSGGGVSVFSIQNIAHIQYSANCLVVEIRNFIVFVTLNVSDDVYLDCIIICTT